MLLSFEEDEKEVLDAVISVLNSFETRLIVKEKYVLARLIFEGIEIDVAKRSIYRNGQELKLTFIEFEILLLLARNAGMIFSKEQIYDIVWKETYSGDYNIVMSHIRNIREKIEDDPSKPAYIQTMWGVGYRFNATV